MTLLSAFPKQTIQKQWQTVPWSFLCAGCLILLVTAKTDSLFSSREKQPPKNAILVPSETPAKFQEETDMRPIIISILLKESVRNPAHRRCEIRTKTNLIKPSEQLPMSKKKQTNRLCTKCKVMGEISLLLSACLLLC